MKRANPLSRAARLARMKREQEEARREREKRFPKPKLVSDGEQPVGDDNDTLGKPRRALSLATDGSNTDRRPSRDLRWRVPGVVPTSSWENVIFAFPGR